LFNRVLENDDHYYYEDDDPDDDPDGPPGYYGEYPGYSGGGLIFVGGDPFEGTIPTQFGNLASLQYL